MSRPGDSIDRVSRNLSLLLRCERLIARRRVTVLRDQSAMMLLAALIATLGLIMLNVAGFFALRNSLSPMGAAFAMALLDLILAAVIVFLALRLDAETELEAAAELRDLAIEELETELRKTAADARAIGNDLRRVVRDPLGSLLPGVIGPLLTLLLSSSKK